MSTTTGTHQVLSMDSKLACIGRRIEERLSLLAQVDERMRFESLLVELSASFVNVAADRVDAHIEEGLRWIVETLQLDRSSFAEYLEDQGKFVVTHCYVVPGFPPVACIIADEQVPWLAAMARRGEAVRLVRLPDDLPPEAVKDREYAVSMQAKSNLTIPLQTGGTLQGAITFGTCREYRTWPDELVQRLRLVGEIFANALARKHAEERMQQLQDQLARVGRVTTMGELAAAIAHEINQPLCAIVTNAQAAQRLLANDTFDREEVREALHDIVADGQRASAVIGRIRNLLQKRQPEKVPLDLNDAIHEVVALLRPQLARKAIALDLNVGPHQCAVLGDRIQLQQVILNLMVNAMEALSRVPEGQRKLAIRSTCQEGEGVVVTITDSGPGIARGQFDRVFDPLYTTKPGGIGIGLAISRSILAAHDGRTWAEPNPASGATFHFALPAAKSAAS